MKFTEKNSFEASIIFGKLTNCLNYYVHELNVLENIEWIKLGGQKENQSRTDIILLLIQDGSTEFRFSTPFLSLVSPWPRIQREKVKKG